MDWTSILAGTKEIVEGITVFIATAFTALVGIWFILSGLNKMLQFSRGERQGQSTAGPIAINLAIGSLMLQFSSTVGTAVETIFGSSAEDPNDIMRYMPEMVGSTEVLSDAVNAAALWVSAIGFVAICRGFILLNELSNGRNAEPRAGWRGAWHIIFGAAAINITGVVRLFSSG